MNSWDLNIEKELLRKAKDDLTSFGPVYDHYFDRIFRYIAFRVQVKDDAHEIVSQTFVKAMTKLDQFDSGKGTFSSWLYKIALNELRMFFRGEKKEQFTFSLDSTHDLLGLQEDSFTEEDKAQLSLILNSLSEDDLRLLEFRFFEGLSFQAIGECLDISKDLAKTRTYRLIKKIRQQLEKVSI